MTAYVIFINEGSLDGAEMQTYSSLVPSTLKDRPITMLSMHGRLEGLEGIMPESVTLVSFPTMADAVSWFESPAYQAAAKHRHAGAAYRVLLLEGTD